MQFDFRLRWAQQPVQAAAFLLLDIHMLSYDPVGQKCQYHFRGVRDEEREHAYAEGGGVIVEEGDPEEVFGAPKMERTKQFLKNYGQS